ncbi:MAG: hypothetical protein ACTHZ5_16080, partial [Micrococcaceae bacterium]
TVMRDIRGLEPAALAETLRDQLLKVEETFNSNDDLNVHQQNRNQLHKLLARITDHITVSSGQASNYIELTNGARVKYEVEHIWANHPERHTDEFVSIRSRGSHRIVPLGATDRAGGGQ